MQYDKYGKIFVSKFRKNSNIIFTCEHASGRVPAFLENLGVGRGALSISKDLFDPFAYDLFKKMHENFHASFVYSNLSRLVIDMNRRFEAKNKNQNAYHSALIKKKILCEDEKRGEFFIDLPKNLKIDPETELKLYNNICLPYQKRVEVLVAKKLQAHDHVYVISVHTMFPKYNGPKREIEIDIMGYPEDKFFQKISQEFLANKNYVVGVNKPWSFKDVDGGALKSVSEMKGVSVVALEIRNDILSSNKGIKDVFEICKQALKISIEKSK